ncbi:MAG TPA: hypothetical protein VF153_01945, partial [Candidatus Limnocylindria bacterium]
LLDRLAALEFVSDWLAENGPPGERDWYHAAVLQDDLRLHLRVLDRAHDAYRELFLDRVNAFLDRVDPALLTGPWELVRQRRLAELVDVVHRGNRDTWRTRLARRVPERQRRWLRQLLTRLRPGGSRR